MTIPSTSGIGQTSPMPGSGSGSGANPLNQLDNSQTFLKLLVAQLQNQNPTSPTSPTAFMTEISQLTAVQAQTSLASEEQVVAADSMLGRTVTGQGSTGTVSGVVTGVLLSSSGAPELQLGGAGAPTLPISAITQVHATPSTATAAATGAATSGSGSTSTGTSTG